MSYTLAVHRQSVFMANNAALVGNGHFYFGTFVQNDALAGQAAFNARIKSPIDKILFFVGQSFQKIVALLHVNMAGGAGADAAAVMVQVDIVFLRDFQDGHVLETSRHRFGRGTLIFKKEFNGGHV